MVIPTRFGFVVLAAAGITSLSVARADSEGNARAVIRGTGKEVTIVYRVPRTASPDVKASPAPDPLTEALHRKASGDDDAAVVAFLLRNQAGLPDVIDAEVVRDFRRAGAGEPVIAALSTFAAIDIGETGEGAPVQTPQPSSEIAPYGGAYPDLVGMGYPYLSSYGGGYFSGGFGRHLGRHGLPRRSASFHLHFGQPFFPKGRPLPAHVSRGARTPHRMR